MRPIQFNFKTDILLDKGFNFEIINWWKIYTKGLQESGKPNYETAKGTRSLDNKQKLTCYERAGNQGDAVILTDYAPYLDNYNFNNRAASCCFEGM